MGSQLEDLSLKSVGEPCSHCLRASCLRSLELSLVLIL